MGLVWNGMAADLGTSGCFGREEEKKTFPNSILIISLLYA
jgi:hypothetical protein